MNWIKKHTDSIATIVAIVSACFWMNDRADKKLEKAFNSLNIKIDAQSLASDLRHREIENRMNEIEKQLAIIKTVLVLSKLMPENLAFEAIALMGEI